MEEIMREFNWENGTWKKFNVVFNDKSIAVKVNENELTFEHYEIKNFNGDFYVFIPKKTAKIVFGLSQDVNMTIRGGFTEFYNNYLKEKEERKQERIDAEKEEKRKRGLKYAIRVQNWDDWDRVSVIDLVTCYKGTREEYDNNSYIPEYKENLHFTFDVILENLKIDLSENYEVLETGYNYSKYLIISEETANQIIKDIKDKETKAPIPEAIVLLKEKMLRFTANEKEEILYFGSELISQNTNQLLHSIGANEGTKSISVYTTIHCKKLNGKSTYDLKEKLREIGCKWNSNTKEWEIEKTEENRQKIVNFLNYNDVKGSPTKLGMVRCWECGNWFVSKNNDNYCGC